MAQPHQTAQASTPLAQPSRPPTYLQAPAAYAKSLYITTTTLAPQLMALSTYSHLLPPQGGSTTPPTSCLHCLWTGSANSTALPMSLTTPAHALHCPTSLTSWVITPTCLTFPQTQLGGCRLLTPVPRSKRAQTPMLLVAPPWLLAGATSSGRSTGPLQAPAHKLRLTTTARELDCPTGQPTLYDPPVGYRSLTPQMLTPPTLPLLAEASTSSCSRTSLA
jgi:hypothetical protein